MKTNYRIFTADRRVKYAGTDKPSWLTLDEARALVNYKEGESIYEYGKHSSEPLWEVF